MNIILSRNASFVLWIAFIAASVGFGNTNVFADNDGPIVPGYQRFAEVEEFTPSQHGQLLLNELNCMACHEGNSSWAMKPKQAPILSLSLIHI